MCTGMDRSIRQISNTSVETFKPVSGVEERTVLASVATSSDVATGVHDVVCWGAIPCVTLLGDIFGTEGSTGGVETSSIVLCVGVLLVGDILGGDGGRSFSVAADSVARHLSTACWPSSASTTE